MYPFGVTSPHMQRIPRRVGISDPRFFNARLGHLIPGAKLARARHVLELLEDRSIFGYLQHEVGPWKRSSLQKARRSTVIPSLVRLHL